MQTSIGYQDERNRPPPLRATVFNGSEKYKLKQSAEQARIFLKHLPFILNGFINYENPFYCLLLQIVSIVQICFSPVTSVLTIDKLRNDIETHLHAFKELFPEVNVTPKMHYMLHVPNQMLQLGTLTRHCCIRFETRHKCFKDLAPQQNFKNICLSLAEQCQLDACADFETENPHQHLLFAKDKEHGSTCLVVNDQRESLLDRIREAELFAKPECLTSIYTSKWIK